MSFDSDGFGINGDVSQRGQGPTMFTYRNLSDSKTDMLTSGYFTGARDYLDIGSQISIQCEQGTSKLVVTGLSPVTVEDQHNNCGSVNLAYGNWERKDAPLILSNAGQLFVPNLELIEPVHVSQADGVFTIERCGAYQIIVERVYKNASATSTDYEVKIEFVLNDVAIYSRTATAPKAPSVSKPAFFSFTSPFIYALQDGDTLSLRFSTPTVGAGTNLTLDRCNATIFRVE